MIKWRRVAVQVLCLAGLGSATIAGAASAQDLQTKLTEAESQAVLAQQQTTQAERSVSSAEERHAASSRRARPAERAATAAAAEAARLKASLASEQRAAANRVSQLEAANQREVDDRDEEVRNGVGFGLAALVAAGLALGWGRLRSSAAVTWLAGMDRAQGFGMMAGAGFALIVLGLVLGGATGAVGALGSFLFCLGFILPIALLLARHSAEVERGREQPLLRRNRLPGWVPIATAGLMLVLFVASTGSALFADDAASEPVSPQLRQEARALSAGPGARELAAAEDRAARLQQAAAGPVARQAATREVLGEARGELRGAERALRSAEADQRRLTRRVAAAAAREERANARLAERAAREAEEAAEEEADELASACHPSYSGCLDPNSPDYDCLGGSGDGPDYTGPVEVIGYDEYDLDRDGDGIGCESS